MNEEELERIQRMAEDDFALGSPDTLGLMTAELIVYKAAWAALAANPPEPYAD